MRILREAVHHGEDDRLPADLGQTLDEVHQAVRPHLGGNLEGLEQPRWSLRRRLVALACRAGTDELLYQPPVMGKVEVGAQEL